MSKFALTGSERTPLAGAHTVGKTDPGERLEVSVLLRRRSTAPDLKSRVTQLTRGDKSIKPIKREEFEQQFGADPADIATLKSFADAHGLVITQQDQARRTVMLSGTVAQFNAAFDVDLQNFEHPDGSYRGRVGAVHVPAALKDVVEGVLGLDNRPQAKPHFRIRPEPGTAPGLRSRAAAATSFTPLQLASLYNFPAGNGAGQCIAIIELGGGYRSPDLRAYFSHLGLPMPAVSTVAVDHVSNSPTGSANGPDGEVMLDIEVAGAVAPGAKIVVYFAPNTDAGFFNAIATAVHDKVNRPSIVSISWGAPESSWTAQSMTAYDQVFQEAAALGVSICVASGDNGSSDGVGDSKDHVDFPAASPHVLACGGTNLHAANGLITRESVWNSATQGGASGGGVSSFFARPPWQEGLKVRKTSGAVSTLKKRGVPDVCGDADPETGYQVRVDGTDLVIGGTSAVAPLWAGLIARINATRGTPLGLLHGQLYAHAAAFKDVTQGNNGDFAAAAHWDACTGLGSPNGVELAAIF